MGWIVTTLILVSSTSAAHADPPSLTTLLRPSDARTLPTLLNDTRPLPPGLSMGKVNRGWLHRPLTVPFDGKILAVIPPNRPRERNFGAATLIQLLEDTAQALHHHDGPRLMMGDLAAVEGGRISHHSSHQSGRDADLAFYYLDALGQPVEADAFHNVDPDGWAEIEHDNGTITRLQFDVATNWRLIRTMMTHPDIDLQYVLVATHLKAAMLEHARRRGDDPDLIERARWMVIQPWNSAPHDDHFHIRVFCGPRDRIEGCIERPPAWPWAVRSHTAMSAVTTRLAEGLRVQPGRLEQALLWLVARHLRVATPALLDLIAAGQGRDIGRLLDATETLVPTHATGARLVALLRTGSSALRHRVAPMVGGLQRARWTGMLARELTRALTRGDFDDAQVLLTALRPMASRRVMPMLLTLLEHHEGQIRAAALAQLEALTFHRDRRWRSKHARTSLDHDAADRWRAWWRTHHREDATGWLRLGMRELGLNVRAMDDVATIALLIEAQEVAPRPLALAAHNVLVQRTRFRGIDHALSPHKRYKRWLHWWDTLSASERAALGQPPPQPRGPWLMTRLDTW